MIRAARVVTVVALAALPAGCAERAPSSTSSSSAATDSAGVRVIGYAVTDLDVPASQPVGDTTPVLRIGAIDGPPGATLNGVRAVAESPSGMLALADDEGTVIRFYGSDGTYLGAQGSEGDGPGEYRSIIGLSFLDGDTLAAYDQGSARLSVIAPDRRFVRSLPLPIPPSRLGFRNRVYGLGSLRGVMLFERPRNPRRLLDGARNMEPRVEQDTLALQILRVTDTGASADTLALVPGLSMYIVPRSNGESRTGVRFGASTFLSGNEGGFVVAHGAAFEIKRYSRDGALEQIIRIDASPRPVTSDDRVASGPQNERTAFADSHPLIANVVLDGNGNLWVAPDEPIAAGRGWIVFSPEGEVRGWASSLGPSNYPRYVGRQFVYASTSDAFDTEYISKYRINVP